MNTNKLSKIRSKVMLYTASIFLPYTWENVQDNYLAAASTRFFEAKSDIAALIHIGREIDALGENLPGSVSEVGDMLREIKHQCPEQILASVVNLTEGRVVYNADQIEI
jgi:hypothetical protein